MRVVFQLAIVTVLAAGGFLGWKYYNETMAAKPDAQANRARGLPTIGVEVLPVRTGTVVEKAEAVGSIRANESIVITAKQAGNVAKIGFDEGEHVRSGQMLIELETRERSAEVDQAKNDLDSARAARDDARQKLERARQLRGTGAITQARLDELDQTLRGAEARVRAAESRIRMLDARLDDVRILAPFAGRIGLRQISVGALVQPGAPIATLDDMSKVKLEFSIAENFLGRLRVGLPVFARTTAYPGKVFEGRVSIIDTRVDPVTRSVRVNAIFDNPEDLLKPGLFTSVELALETRANALLVPEEALVPEGARQFVFAIRDGKAIRQEVKLGSRAQGAVEIVEGVKAGENVVVRGTSRVRHNQPVNTRPLQAPQS
jgi:membrane fusion protein (multidrug efflux system)